MDKLNRRIRGRVNEDNFQNLMAASRKKGKSQSKEINAALSCYYSNERDDMRDSRILARLDMMVRHNHRHSRDLNFITEIMALFLQYFFTMAPPQKASDMDVHAAKGVSFLNEFVDQLGLRMKDGGKTFKRALDDILVADEDFFKLDELALLKALSAKRISAPSPKETEDA